MTTPNAALAHEAMRELWEVTNHRLQGDDVELRTTDDKLVRCLHTELGASAYSFAGIITVGAEFDNENGAEEMITIVFPEDIRDLSKSEVSIDWRTEEKQGTNTPPMRDYPKIAREILALL